MDASRTAILNNTPDCSEFLSLLLGSTFLPTLPKVSLRWTAKVDWPRQKDSEIIKSFQKSTIDRAHEIKTAIVVREEHAICDFVEQALGHGGLTCVPRTLLTHTQWGN
ncbi:unnamed protein product [Sympodiomycopsis kandeliae]